MAKEYRVLSEAASRDEVVINELASDGYVLDFVVPNHAYFVRDAVAKSKTQEVPMKTGEEIPVVTNETEGEKKTSKKSA